MISIYKAYIRTVTTKWSFKLRLIVKKSRFRSIGPNAYALCFRSPRAEPPRRPDVRRKTTCEARRKQITVRAMEPDVATAKSGPGAPAPGQCVDIGGRRMHHLAAGSGAPMVIFESGGAGGTSMSDLPLLRRISAFTRGCIYDRAGLGWSDPGPAGRSFDERAGDLRACCHGQAPSRPMCWSARPSAAWAPAPFAGATLRTSSAWC